PCHSNPPIAPTPQATIPTSPHFSAANRGTIAIHPTNPSTLTAAATRNALVKCPVLWTMNPVAAGATIPARFPSEFWMPTQRPDAHGPARISLIAYTPGEEAPHS